METATRRSLLKSLAVVGASATAAATAGAAFAAETPGQTRPAGESFERSEKVRQGIRAAAAVAGQCQWSDAEKKDRQRVIDAGFSEQEATCWLLVNRAAATFLTLPELHPSDVPELTILFHELQAKLMSRPVYRKYRELAELPLPPR